MVIENKLTKRLYRRMILQDLLFGTINGLVFFVLYVLLWRILYTITKIGQLKTNLPIFLGISFLLFAMVIRVFIVYRRQMKKDFLFQPDSQIEIDDHQLIISPSQSAERHTFPLESLMKVKETKKWYFLYFQDKTIFPITKETKQSQEKLREIFRGFKPVYPILWKWTKMLFLLTTIVGGYSIYSNAVNFNGALAWKINELKTDTGIKLENDNFYQTRLNGIIDSVRAKVKLEPYLMTNDLEINFAKDGTITSIDTYIYGFDQNKKLKSGYLIYFDKAKDNKVTIHKQDWHGQGTTVYDPNNDFSIIMNMLESIPVEKEVKRWNEENAAVMYKGIRNWGYNLDGIRFISKMGKIFIPSIADTEITGPTISLYVPGKENFMTPERYVFRP
ncbi:YcxB family protein [Cytobacillus sp. Hz8]|uniref:YcxB family protein n=1 Tax=Cytobacillus sp. Hz8 TaxID=3347168 RepID=UPI0035DC14BC